MIVDRIREKVRSGMIIPKPEAKADFVVKGWGRRRGEKALIYTIPNHNNPEKPYEKGITDSEFELAYQQLQRSGELTRAWFDEKLPACNKEGSCNFTSVGGIFELLGEATYSGRGAYQLRR